MRDILSRSSYMYLWEGHRADLSRQSGWGGGKGSSETPQSPLRAWSVWSWERKPTSKGPLTDVKCKQRNAHTRAIIPVFNKALWIDFLTKILLCCWFHYFSVLSRFSEPFWKLLRSFRAKLKLIEDDANGFVNRIRDSLSKNQNHAHAHKTWLCSFNY